MHLFRLHREEPGVVCVYVCLRGGLRGKREQGTSMAQWKVRKRECDKYTPKAEYAVLTARIRC